MTPPQLKALLYQALAEPIGLALRATPTGKVRQRLYAARSAAKDPRLEALQIRVAPQSMEEEGITLLLVHGLLEEEDEN